MKSWTGILSTRSNWENVWRPFRGHQFFLFNTIWRHKNYDPETSSLFLGWNQADALGFNQCSKTSVLSYSCRIWIYQPQFERVRCHVSRDGEAVAGVTRQMAPSQEIQSVQGHPQEPLSEIRHQRLHPGQLANVSACPLRILCYRSHHWQFK